MLSSIVLRRKTAWALLMMAVPSGFIAVSAIGSHLNLPLFPLVACAVWSWAFLLCVTVKAVLKDKGWWK